MPFWINSTHFKKWRQSTHTFFFIRRKYTTTRISHVRYTIPENEYLAKPWHQRNFINCFFFFLNNHFRWNHRKTNNNTPFSGTWLYFQARVTLFQLFAISPTNINTTWICLKILKPSNWKQEFKYNSQSKQLFLKTADFEHGFCKGHKHKEVENTDT